MTAPRLSTTTEPSQFQPSSGARLRFDFLDGLRGVMALYVVLFHACYFALDLPLNPIGATAI